MQGTKVSTISGPCPAHFEMHLVYIASVLNETLLLYTWQDTLTSN